MVSFHEVRFPADISFKAKGGPEFNTDVVVLSSGHEKRNVSWEIARARYELNYKDISRSQSKDLQAFFMARRGRAYGFRFKDWNDFEAKEQIIGTGNGVKTQFQLVKKYGEQDYQYQRKISKPVSGSLLLFVDSAERSTGFSVDYNAGIITFSDAPEVDEVITATFEFDVPTRFNTDLLQSETESYAKNSLQKVELIEVKI